MADNINQNPEQIARNIYMNNIDINFDFRQDSKCNDPDIDSEKLYESHKILWSKTLPNGKILDLNIVIDSYGRILLKNNIYSNFSSDRMCPHYVGKYNNKFKDWLSESENEELQYKVRTIGGHIIYPAHKKNGFTINQARGVNRMICDRFDLTLECIRRYYIQMQSPLYNTLVRYSDFFDLFMDFDGYIDFFMLQDFITEKKQIDFSLPFDNFNRSPLPLTIEEYKQYKNHTINLIDKRNYRISKCL